MTMTTILSTVKKNYNNTVTKSTQVVALIKCRYWKTPKSFSYFSFSRKFHLSNYLIFLYFTIQFLIKNPFKPNLVLKMVGNVASL